MDLVQSFVNDLTLGGDRIKAKIAANRHNEVYGNSQLNASRQEIRVVHILPGLWDEKICCELQIISLAANPVYEALSYVWGSPKNTVKILVNGVRLRVTANLGAALRRLRKPTETREIWIDALCINQLDNEEKNTQVNMMGIIFKNCVECIVWLGEQPDPKPQKLSDTPPVWLANPSAQDFEDILNDPKLDKDPVLAAFIIIYMMSKNLHIHETPCFVSSHSKDEEDSWTLDPRLREGQRGLELITKNDWWTRIWTVQETILPVNITVVFGAVQAPWEIFSTTIKGIFIHKEKRCCKYQNLKKDIYRALHLDLRKFVQDIDRVRSDMKKGKYWSLATLLLEFSNRKSTNELDMVFALLGLLEPGSEDSVIIPEYNLSVKELYTKVTLHLIAYSRSLWPFVYCFANDGGLQSWALDWRHQPQQPREIMSRNSWLNMNSFYDIGGKTPLLAKPIDDYLLHLKGMKLGTILAASRVTDMNYIAQEAVPDFEEVSRLSGNELISKHSQYRSGCDWAEAYCKTLIGDLLLQNYSDEVGSMSFERPGPGILDVAKDWWSLYMTGQEIPDSTTMKMVLDFNDSACIMLHNRRFFVTENGYLGTGPIEMLPGDEVYVLAGGEIPFVLRKSSKKLVGGTILQGPQFTLLGACYVHGIMFGELNLHDEDYGDIVLV